MVVGDADGGPALVGLGVGTVIGSALFAPCDCATMLACRRNPQPDCGIICADAQQVMLAGLV